MDVHANAVAGALDFDPGNTGAVELLLEKLANLDVFGDEVAVALPLGGAVGEPARRVVGGDSESETVGVDFLTHYLLTFCDPA
ncbi:MAG: Uncharacterised protein [Cellulomonadaceae bacterium TMED98]|nr:MAG: Uncharacterised protein [Cellulomonadaceae bacterium TMED98]